MTQLFTTLISASQLQALLDAGGRPVILDASFDLADTSAGERSFREGHLPGARYVDLDHDLCTAPTGTNGRHPLPTRPAFAATLGRLGVAPDAQVIAVDRQGGMYAARLWWMLRWVGHEAVAVLDGGVPAWQQAGGALQKTDVQPFTTLPPYPLHDPLVDSIRADSLAESLAETRLVDARAPERFRGEIEPLDARAGHIPGARNRFFKDNLLADGRFKPAAQLRRDFEPLLAGRPPTQVVHQCGSGVTACHNLLAMEIAGLGGSILYPGSWSEWSADPARPIAQG